jgi:hypothetical protein
MLGNVSSRGRGFECVNAIQIATGAVVITHDLAPVVNSTNDQLGMTNWEGDICNRPIGKLDVDMGV